ncbi:MAG TPA: LppX_LprAFG lipoprotein [Nocardioides sp.]|uniref:LppX_LprAFG lipoprotein n=1 Tax=Nocardioides sp. TaxID=35761 RepID=UPI002F401ED3
MPRLILLIAAVALAVTACGGSSSSHEDPVTALKTAQQKLEQTSGVSLTLSTDDLPDGVQGLESASGTVTDAPAYDGKLGVVTRLGSFSVPVKSVGGKVYAQIPLTPGWSEVNPADYGAPDPAQLISADSGVPSILAATEDAKRGKDIRGGSGNREVLSTYTGTVPASAVASIIPGATGDFDATYALTPDDELRQVSLTGAFYGPTENTYTLVLTDYGTSKDITAP